MRLVIIISKELSGGWRQIFEGDLKSIHVVRLYYS